jgi:hypothetical protein
VLLGCRLALPRLAGGDFHSTRRIRKIPAWPNNANRKLLVQVDYKCLTTGIWHDVRSILSSLRIARVPQQFFDEFFISGRPNNGVERVCCRHHDLPHVEDTKFSYTFAHSLGPQQVALALGAFHCEPGTAAPRPD